MLSGHAAQQLERYKRTLQLVSHLRHPNIVAQYGMQHTDDTITIFMEYVHGGSLDKLLKSMGPLESPAVAKFTTHIARGLAYLHQHRIVHRHGDAGDEEAGVR